VVSALTAKILPLTLFETRRLVGGLVGIVGLAATWRIGRRLGGPVAGLIALVLLATCPLYDGNMYINAKDGPFATAMTILLLAVVRGLDEYPAPSRRTVVFVGVGIGLGFGSRVLAAVTLFVAIIALLTVLVEELQDRRRDAWRRLGGFIWSMLPAVLIGYLMMGLLWPWSVLKPLNPIYASDYFSNFFEKPWHELFEGKLYSVPDMPARYLPVMFGIQLPEIMLLLGLCGGALAVWTGMRGRFPSSRNGALFVVVLAAFFPVVLAMVAHPALYNGLRHFVFVVPPFAVLGGLAGAAAFDRARARSAVWATAAAVVFLGGVALPVSDIVRLHPFQYSTYNWISGGVKMAHKNFMLDYWGLAFKQTADALKTKLDAMHLKPPDGRRWIVEICGPQSSAQVELGPQFETTWDRKTADFAMMLGTFYCRDKIPAPVLVEVRREGILYGRVYDIRGMNAPPLLTEPPPS
jgi:4-amino-4-deoxy-L-arabinose transferase-like glycosyltransferase